MSTLTAIVEPEHARVRLELRADAPMWSTARLWRVVGGTRTAVRLPVLPDVRGEMPLSGGVGVVYDTEAPLDQPVCYEATSTDTPGMVVARPQVGAYANGGFEADADGWAGHEGAILRTPEQAHAGGWSLRFTAGAGMTGGPGPQGPTAPVVQETMCRFEAWVWSLLGHPDMWIGADWETGGHAYMTTTNLGSRVVPAGRWVKLSGEVLAPRGSGYGRLRVSLGGTAAATDVFYIDDAQMWVPQTAGGGLFADTFPRDLAGGWGAPDVGPAWTMFGGLASEYTVAGGLGVQRHAAANVPHTSIVDLGSAQQRVRASVVLGASLPVGSFVEHQLVLAAADADTQYQARLRVHPSGAGEVFLVKRIRGVETTLGGSVAVPGGALPASAEVVMLAEAFGTTTRMKAWRADDAEPGWLISVDDTDRPKGSQVRLWTSGGTGLTSLPYAVQWDNVVAEDLSAGTGAACATVPSNGVGWLRDPLRPWRDLRIELGKKPACPDDEPRVWFVGFDGPEVFADDSAAFDVAGEPMPSQSYDVRKAPTSTLLLSTKTLTDRDRLLALLSPGSPLLLQLPAVYGWAAQYLLVGPVSVARMSRDHRKPWRRFSLPFSVGPATVGPPQGVAGARWADQCAVYGTWAELEAAGLTGIDVLAGAAG